jgi:hypothetical protein
MVVETDYLIIWKFFRSKYDEEDDERKTMVSSAKFEGQGNRFEAECGVVAYQPNTS